ncbi:DUF433 domain-containing protein [Synechococcus elongatus IITB7]|uniref:DUF433 domain-containing protein n=1 Tax=Synechococcus elongatus TaxID=32046 RepID=UPI0030CDC9E3
MSPKQPRSKSAKAWRPYGNQRRGRSVFSVLGTAKPQRLKITLRHGLVERRPEVCSGALVFRGTRILVAQVVGQIRQGVPLEEIQEDYPALDAAALRYAQQLARREQWKIPQPRSLRLRRMRVTDRREATY